MSNAKMATRSPAAKVVAGGLAGGVTALVVYILNAFVLAEPLPAEVANALLVLVTFVVGYLKSPAPKDQIKVSS